MTDASAQQADRSQNQLAVSVLRSLQIGKAERTSARVSFFKKKNDSVVLVYVVALDLDYNKK